MLVSPKILRREYGEATTICAVYLVIYWLKNLISDLRWFSIPSTFAWAISISFYVGASLCLLFIMEKIVRRRNLSVVGFRLPTNRDFLLIVAGIVAFYLVRGIIQFMIFEIQFPYLDIYFVSAVFLVPFVEEIVFRGLIQTRLEAGLGAVRSWVLCGLLFGFYYFLAWFLIEGRMLTAYSIVQVIAILLLGILWGMFFAETKSLLPPFLLHAVNNFVVLLF